MFINKVLDTFLVIFTVLVIAILVAGDRTYPKVASINLSTQGIPVATNQIVISFNREVNRQSVEANFRTSPSFEGQFSWIGNKMAYTFDQPLNYDQKLKVLLQDAYDSKGHKIKQFYFTTQVEPQIIFFLETEESTSRLVKKNLTSHQKEYLTPENLIVLEFKHAPGSNRVYFFATEKSDLDETNFISDLKQLYSININSKRVRLLASSKKYLNFEFDISPDSRHLVLTRAKIQPNNTRAPIKTYLSRTNRVNFKTFWNKNIANAEVIFAPSSDAILGFNSDLGYLLVPIKPDPEKVVEFGWMEFIKSYGFSLNGNKLAFSTSNSADDTTNFITTFSRGNIREQFFLDNNSDYFENVQFLPKENSIIYLRNKDLSENFIQILNLTTLEIKDINFEFKNLETFSVSPNQKYLIAEVYDSVPGRNYGPDLRSKVESFENRFYSPNLYIIDLETLQKIPLNLNGRMPAWKQ